jgi:Fur family ferric uptake transcriptional regulator
MNRENKLPALVREKFDAYLTEHKCRKTPERYAILEVIYSDTRHFNMDTLYDALAERNFRVSRATLYNTMQLLLDCNLVLKHQFGKNISLYERAYNNDMHFHLICTHCNKVTEFKNPTLQTMFNNLKIKQFTAMNFNLNIFGICNLCARTIKKQNTIKNKNK